MEAMIEYAKVILPKVLFSRELFQKELSKCIGWMEQKDMEEFYKWCQENFGNIYPEILAEAFKNIAA